MKNSIFAKYGLLTVCLFSISLMFGQTKETHKLPPFQKLDIGGGFEVFLRLGDTHEMVVVADEKQHQRLDYEVENGTLTIGLKKGWSSTNNTKLYITAVQLQEIDLSGAVNLKASNTIRGEFLNLTLSGAAQVKMPIDAELISVDGSGACEVALEGVVGKLKLDLSGASEIKAPLLKAKNATIDMSGASSGYIQVLESISLELSGASTLKMEGKAKVDYQETTGASTFKRI